MSAEHENSSRSVRPGGGYFVDFWVFVAVLLVVKHPLRFPFYPPLFLSESSEGFMQLTYYLKALRAHESLLWDRYLLLSTQEAPQMPIFSPVTWGLLLLAQAFHLQSQASLATLYLSVSYLVQVLIGYSLYAFLRYLGLGRGSAILGGIAYAYNFFSEVFGVSGGLYRASALALMPMVFLSFHRLFASRGGGCFPDLSEEQQSKLRAEKFKFEESKIDLEAQLKHTRLAYMQTLSDPKGDYGAAKSAARDVASAHSKLMSAKEGFKAEVAFKVLTADQRQQAAKCFHGGGHRWGHPGWGRPGERMGMEEEESPEGEQAAFLLQDEDEDRG